MRIDVSLPMLRTSRLTIRLPEIEEAPAIAAFFRANMKHLEPWGPRFPEGMGESSYWATRIEHEREAAEVGAKYRFFLFEGATPIGNANLNEIVRGGTHSCTLSYCLGADREGNGLMTEALREVIRFGFDDLNLHRIEACYQPKNIRSANVLARLGFEIEATLKQLILVGGVWEDHVLTSLINDDWRPS